MSHYRIEVRGHLDPAWSPQWGLTIHQRAAGTTLLHGELRDEAALLGCLQQLSGLGATILSVERIPHPQEGTNDEPYDEWST
ncbi:MAG: hypothetical protein KDD73_05275 [Anaerolineales bacterium]|nr:hypothetical protein [Anaerolineales bacterium]MCB9126719.1 hypothetical protein [Ardenticatenales bacterium]MCB9171739.1 hypothetical protein [Ardenticatenales bacterium]